MVESERLPEPTERSTNEEECKQGDMAALVDKYMQMTPAELTHAYSIGKIHQELNMHIESNKLSNSNVTYTAYVMLADNGETAITVTPKEFLHRPLTGSQHRAAKRAVKSNEDGVQELAINAIIKINGKDESVDEPQGAWQLPGHPLEKECRSAAKSELDGIVANGTRELIPASSLPDGVRPIKCKWVWKFKVGSLGELIKVKARLVARGDMQTYGVDYTDTYANTVKSKSLKLMLAIMVHYKLESQQIDYQQAFLNALVAEDIYMEQPPMFIVPPTSGSKEWRDRLVWKLNKSLYGIKQAPRNWNKMVDSLMTRQGFKPLLTDSCVYVRISKTGRPIIVSLYVDDKVAVLHRDDMKEWSDFKEAIRKEFKIDDLGECKWILRMAVRRSTDKRVLWLSQERYVREVLKRFEGAIDKYGTKRRSGVRNPASTSDELRADGGAKEENRRLLDKAEAKLFQQIVGSLMYAANLTRFDIAYITNALASYMSAPRQQHIIAAVRVLQYLHGTAEYCICMRRATDDGESLPPGDDAPPLTIVCYSDSNWAEDKDTRRSHTGVIALVNGVPIHIISQRQKTVALSSGEAEIMASCDGAKESLAISHFLKELAAASNGRISVDDHTTIRIDNQAAIAVTREDCNNKRTKHIDTRYMFLREAALDGRIKVEWVSTKEQLADILTKPVATTQYRRMVSHLLAPDDHSLPTSRNQFLQSIADEAERTGATSSPRSADTQRSVKSIHTESAAAHIVSSIAPSRAYIDRRIIPQAA